MSPPATAPGIHAGAPGGAGSPSVTVVVCAYSDERRAALEAAVASVRRQTRPAAEIVVAVDHNPGLLGWVRERMPDVVAVAAEDPPGLSGARNAGVARARGDVVAFLDDDAEAAADWLERLLEPYARPEVLGVGGHIEPRWLGGRPAAFPAEFGWVVGCSYRGLPSARAPVRNLIGASMSMRREVFAEVGGFRGGMGRVGAVPQGCEETEWCIRARARRPGGVFVHEPAARVDHVVPPARAGWRYFGARCLAEGRSKAQVARAAGARAGLAAERTYVLRTLPAGVFAGLRDATRGDATGLLRAAAIVAGLCLTALGYVTATAGAPRG